MDGDDLVIALTLVEHFHYADSFGPQKAHGLYRLLHYDKNVKGIFIFAVRSGNEPVVVWIYNRRVQHPIHHQHAGVLVQLILDLKAQAQEQIKRTLQTKAQDKTINHVQNVNITNNCPC